MKSEWIETTIGDFAPFTYGKGLKSDLREEGKVPVYGSNGQVDTHNEDYVESAGIIIGRKGSVGEVHLSDVPFWPIDTTFYVTKSDLEELWFTYYLLQSVGLNTMNSDSAVPGLNRDRAHSVEIKIPADIQVRKKIGRYLHLFDQKIQLNQEIKKNLESIAQAIFKSWFVDFDPVQAKIHANNEGNDPVRAAIAAITGISLDQDWENIEEDLKQKLSDMTESQLNELKQTATFFPNEFEGSELGEIPKGWHVGTVGELCGAQGGYAFKSKLFNDHGGNPVVKIKNIKENFSVDLQDCQYLSDQDISGKERYELTDGDYVIAMTGATVGKTGIVVSDSDKVLLNQRVAKFTSEEFNKNINWFIHSAFLATNLREKVESVARGSAQPNISASGIESISMIIPSKEIIKRFLRIVDPLFQKWVISTKENQQLMQLRDLLLPRLISGEITT